MTLLLQRFLSAGVLMVWGAVLCFLYFSGRITAYLHPHFHVFAVSGGIVLVLLAMLVLVAPDEGAPAGCGAPKSGALWKSLLAALVLVAPLLIALSASRDAYSSTTVMNRNYVQDISQLPGAQPSVQAAAPADASLPGSDTSAGGDQQPEVRKNDKGEIEAEVVDFLYAAQLPDMRQIFEDKQVEVIGQLMPARENNPNGDRYDLVRMMMTCCAADAQPVAIPVQPAAKPGVPEMTWVKVHGKATFPVVGGQKRPLIENATIEKTDPPEDTYLY